jgi:hypothetical protein
MNKYFFISNRQSGKTHLAIYEFLKNPEESILVVQNYKQIKHIIDKDLIPDNFIEKIISVGSENNLRGFKAKRIIFDDYLQIDTIKRSELYIDTSIIDPEELFCFSTPNKIYESKMFNFVRGVKLEKKFIEVEDYLTKNELLLEMNDLEIKTQSQIKNEILDLYYNHITDPDTIIIHNKGFYNERIYKLENVSYFPDIDRELTELKGKYLRN